MKKLLSIAMLSLALTACTPIKQYNLDLGNGERITYNCFNYSYSGFSSTGVYTYSEYNPLSLKIKELCKNKEK